MDLSMAFDYVPHDLLLTKLASYGIDNLILYIHSIVNSVCINNILREFNKVISGDVGPILFSFFFNDF